MCGEGFMELREELRGKRFGLGHRSPHLFVIPQCLPAKFYLVWVSVWALFYAVTLSFEIHYNAEYGAKYFIYLTNWSYLLQSILVFTDFTVTVFTYLQRKDVVKGDVDCTSWYIKFLWVLFNTNNVISVTVTLLYYVLLDPVFNHGSINTHLLNSFYTILTFIFCAKPVQLLHFYQPMIYATCYTFFSVIYHVTGNEPVYTVLDWADPGPAARLTVILIFIGIPFFHLVVFALFTFRKWLSEKCGCIGNTQIGEKKLEKELTTRDVELNLAVQTTPNSNFNSNSVHPA